MPGDLGNKEIMASNIKHYMALNNLSSVDMCRILSVPPSTFSYWLNAKTYPRIDKIEKMANYFKITKADLVEKRVEHTPNFNQDIYDMAKIAVEDQRLLELYHKADEFDQQTIWHILSRYDEEQTDSSVSAG